MIYCLMCGKKMTPIAEITQLPTSVCPVMLSQQLGWLCEGCGNVYDIRQIGESNKELERDYDLRNM